MEHGTRASKKKKNKQTQLLLFVEKKTGMDYLITDGHIEKCFANCGTNRNGLKASFGLIEECANQHNFEMNLIRVLTYFL